MLWLRSLRPIEVRQVQQISRKTPAYRRVLSRNQSSSSSEQLDYATCRDAASLLRSVRSRASEERRVVITAHVRSVRLQKKRAFVALGDGSTTQTIQALLAPTAASGLTTGTAVKITGIWQPCPPSKEQTHELLAEEVEILGASDPETYPIRKHYLSPEYLRTLPHLRLRTQTNALLARLRSECEHQASDYFRDGGYVRLHPPVITSSDCEGAGEVFSVQPNNKTHLHDAMSDSPTQQSPEHPGRNEEFFRSPKYLTVSNQLHLEAFVHEHQRVWALAPTFRAERSDTPRHLSEFYMLEAELRCDSLSEIMDVVETLTRHLSQRIRDSSLGKELLELHRDDRQPSSETRRQLLIDRWEGLRRSYWPRITYTHAIQMLKQAAQDNPDLFSFQPNWDNGLQLEHERFIARQVGNGSPVFVTNYPKHVKPFYMLPTVYDQAQAPSRANREHATIVSSKWEAHSLPARVSQQEQMEHLHPTVACFDLLLPDVGELVGGSLREHRPEILEKSMRDHDMVGLDWYLELRKYGTIPHGGFGLGFDRLLMYLSGAESVRDIVQWPRYYGRCDA